MSNIRHADHPLDACGTGNKGSLVACYDYCIARVNKKQAVHQAIIDSTPPKQKPAPTEMRLKQWVFMEAKRRNLSPITIQHKLSFGEYAHLKLRHVNKRVIFVQLDSQKL